MHIYFSGIGGMAIGPLARIARAAGFTVSGSDKQDSPYIQALRKDGIADIHIGQEYDQIAAVHAKEPIDWFVYTSALPMEQPDAPELAFCQDHDIRASKRDEFLDYLLKEKQLKLIAVAGTHGKTTTTAMLIWLFLQLKIPISYSVGAKLSFGDMGVYNPQSQYFIYEADEFDRNFLAFEPYATLITGIDWDHPDIYPTKESYDDAFRQFLKQSENALLWKADAEQLQLRSNNHRWVIDDTDSAIDEQLSLAGHVNRLNAWQVAQAVQCLTSKPLDELLEILNEFPGVSRRFEKIAPHIFSDYAHTPPKIRGALQVAEETAQGSKIVVVYEGLHNTRQHFIKDELKHLFDSVSELYIVPSYLAREDPSLKLLTPENLKQLLSSEMQSRTKTAVMGKELQTTLQAHADKGDLVLLLSAGGGNSLHQWAVSTFGSK
jgi:UDP-N-acetylmuramate--alanine ligase